MITLGIYNLSSDPSAAIVKDGAILAFCEEERLLRFKHASGIFPALSILQVLRQCNLSLSDIDNIAIPWDCKFYDGQDADKHFLNNNEKYGITHPNDIAYQTSRKNHFKSANFKNRLLKKLRKIFGDVKIPEIHFVNHHESHAIPAFLSSGFMESLVLIVDGSGEETTLSVWKGINSSVELLSRVTTPISLGWFYSAFTEYLGFNAYGDEWQVMGLASYGLRSESYFYAKEKFSQIIWYDGNGGVEGNPHLLSLGTKTFSDYCSDAFVSHLGYSNRYHFEEIQQIHKDFALAAQEHLEIIIEDLVKHWVNITGINKICLAGGVAMNVKMNGRLFESDFLESVFVFPVSSDSGTSLGAAMALQYEMDILKESKGISNVYLGNFYTDQEIENELVKCNLKFSKVDSIEKYAARMIESGKIIGWFQLGMEAGQRALGARSILADPRKIEIRDKVNKIIKYRQPWRPFCPSMIESAVVKYFIHGKKIARNFKYPMFNFMTLTLTANECALQEIPAVVHVDKTSRIQLVTPAINLRYYNLIKEFENITGVGALLNTSFNIKGEPIVCTPTDAIRTFFGTGLDVLILGSYIVEKEVL